MCGLREPVGLYGKLRAWSVVIVVVTAVAIAVALSARVRRPGTARALLRHACGACTCGVATAPGSRRALDVFRAQHPAEQRRKGFA
ncbi:hypothetical protein BN2475_120251 [Paraburkholderia ribeironis]|uniref:Uncharacterized protein n=1 Tax=Paraburkholderia ribeironis TaxID=1247936 RepID=A0A1N7RRZ3_9BURK|nr:hypothetical protein BN2475_120251 [Paraburkholderia ribeironis]